MRLKDLNPTIELVLVATTGHPVMMAHCGDWRLSFWCPCCGKPFSCSIFVGEDRRESPRRWKAEPLPVLVEDAYNKFTVQAADAWFDKVTITPSIGYECGHGPKKPTCTFHGNITNGEVSFPGQL